MLLAVLCFTSKRLHLQLARACVGATLWLISYRFQDLYLGGAHMEGIVEVNDVVFNELWDSLPHIINLRELDQQRN